MIRFRDYPERRYWPIHLSLALMRVIAPMPRTIQLRIGRGIGALEYRMREKGRRIAERNISVCFPELDERARGRLVRRHFESLGLYIVELATAWWGNEDRLRSLGRLEGLEHLERALERGRGALMLTGHFTTSEIAAHILALHVPELTGFFKPHGIKIIDEILLRSRERRLTPVAHTRVKTMMRMLKEGRVLWYAPDLETAGPTALVPFFSEPAVSSVATSRVARASGAPVVPFLPLRLPDDSGYRLVFLPELEDFPGKSLEADTERFHRLLEAHIRQDPAQYFWLHPKFMNRPPDLPDVYEGLRLGGRGRRGKGRAARTELPKHADRACSKDARRRPLGD